MPVLAPSTAPAVTREELHLRHIEMRGYRRSDGLFEVEGRVVDTKPYVFVMPSPGPTVMAGDEIHNLGVRLVFDAEMVVREVSTFTNSAPYAACRAGGEALQSIVGLRMGAGWNSEIRARLSGSCSCTHLRELLGPLATAAHQSMGYLRVVEPDRLNALGRPVQIDSCYAYAATGAVVRHRWPSFSRSEG